jgi:hypothetical protein
MSLARAGAALRRLAGDANAAADALARAGRVAGTSDRARAEEINRNLRPQEIAALKKKLGLA